MRSQGHYVVTRVLQHQVAVDINFIPTHMHVLLVGVDTESLYRFPWYAYIPPTIKFSFPTTGKHVPVVVPHKLTSFISEFILCVLSPKIRITCNQWICVHLVALGANELLSSLLQFLAQKMYWV